MKTSKVIICYFTRKKNHQESVKKDGHVIHFYQIIEVKQKHWKLKSSWNSGKNRR